MAAAIGDAAQVAELDATVEAAVEEHADAVERTGGIDVSLNLISRGDVQGIPLAQMELGQFEGVFDIGLRSLFLTARAAARRMAERGSGVILHLNSGSAAGAQAGMGNTGPVDAASEVFMRYLAVENGASGVRVAGIHTAAVEETLTAEKLGAVSEQAPSPEQVIAGISAIALLGRPPRMADVAETAAFLASDRAAGITASITNVTCGLIHE